MRLAHRGPRRRSPDAKHIIHDDVKNSRVTGINRYGEVGPGPAGTVMTVSFELEGQEFTALNGGPEYKFTEHAANEKA
jgi:predicted 3-demethylubiquinone-9 3-methyltransferase (glyoxalase superfamily)